jgi:hypothetical protein
VEIRPTVVKFCLDLLCVGISYSGFYLLCHVGFWGVGGDPRKLLGVMVRALAFGGRRVGGWGS